MMEVHTGGYTHYASLESQVVCFFIISRVRVVKVVVHGGYD